MQHSRLCSEVSIVVLRRMVCAACRRGLCSCCSPQSAFSGCTAEEAGDFEGFETTYGHDFGGMECWAYGAGIKTPLVADKGAIRPGSRGQRRYRLLGMPLTYSEPSVSYPSGRGRQCSSKSRQPRNTYVPFESRDTPRGKFCAFPTSLTRVLPSAPDPLGFTPYGPSSATGLAALTGGYAVSAQPLLGIGLDPATGLANRGRAARFPKGGYSINDWQISATSNDATGIGAVKRRT